MALVAESVSHLFTPPHQPTDYSDHRPASRAASSRPSRSTSRSERARDVVQPLMPMSHTTGGQQSYHEDHPESATSTATQRTGHGPRTSVSESSSRQRGGREADAMDATPSDNAIARASTSNPSTPAQAATTTTPPTPQRLQVRDLSHIQSFAHNGPRHGSRAGSRRDANVQYDISGMPIENIIEMVAGLLTKITNTNDMQHEHLHRQMPPADNASSISPQTSSVLAFHGKNVPSITILSYLNRIQKYCPTSYEVFLSLLVYFDRMTEKVNSGPIQSLREQDHQHRQQAQRQQQQHRQRQREESADTQPHGGKASKEPEKAQTVTPPASGHLEEQDQHGAIPGTPHSRYQDSPPASSSGLEQDLNLSHFFVVDSFNIHRLVIAGVTCASKFFSDIFYTNSRYAKVGGLPLPELNHLELQFLLLNDFRLSVPVEELEAYGTMLVEFYAREVLAQEQSGDMDAETGQRTDR